MFTKQMLMVAPPTRISSYERFFGGALSRMFDTRDSERTMTRAKTAHQLV